MTALLDLLEARRASGRKLLVPYLMGGLPSPESFAGVVNALTEHADALEIGLPYSDPLMDGPVIAAAAERAIEMGVGPLDAVDLVADVEPGTPLLAMTYLNPVLRVGEAEFCRRAVKAGFAGLIVPDVPAEESGDLRAAAADTGLAWVPLVAPTSGPERVELICEGATGFVYAVSTLGVTGVRESLSERASFVVERVRASTDVPVLVGIGISTAGQAVEAAEVADGVVIGSAVVSRLQAEGVGAAADFLASVRAALDGAFGGPADST